MLNYIPSFPFPGVVWEAGVFYQAHRNGSWDRLPNLVSVVADPSQLDRPDCGKQVLMKAGYLEKSLEAGFERLREYFDSLK